ncbi:MAG: SDR family oxidoreductase [Trichodesmium sp. St16_bin2-tuft]|nr:SDR family oxidoreductase [Trichodesmium sp. St16_bin2-tuft]MDE5109309.1 SDR family oxidoreductase [Trichodesmium sp. St17_bin3_1_1]
MFLVTGATGGLGHRIIRILTEKEMSVRAFTRLNSAYSELENRGAEVFIGDLKIDKDIYKACQGIEYIISAHGGASDVQAVDYRANIELIDSGVKVGVKHFVFISVLGTDRGYEDSPTFKAKREVEKYLKASGLNYTILQPSGFASNLLPLAERFRDTGVYLLIGDPKNRTSIVSTDDLAKIAVDSVSVQAACNQTLPVGGPEIISRGEISQIFSRVFKREPILINPPLFLFDGLRNTLGLFNPELQKTLGTLRVLLANEFFCTSGEIENLERIFEMKMESVESYICRQMGI